MEQIGNPLAFAAVHRSSDRDAPELADEHRIVCGIETDQQTNSTVRPYCSASKVVALIN